MKETTISLLALLALFLLKVVLADEQSLPFHLPTNETFDLQVFLGNSSVGAYPRCGRQGGGGKCIKAGECCSIWGWCGTTSAYCAPGNCQSQCVKPSPPPPSPPPPSPPPPSPPPPLPYPRCGRQSGGGKCIKAGECCSIWGWCGTTSAYCAPGNCQSQCVKPSPPPPSPPPPSPPPPSPPPPLPYPRCGRQSGGGKCIKAGECCSIWGWCGTTSAYCAPGNCQSQCVKPSPPPPSPPPPSPPPPSPPPPLPYPGCGRQSGGGKCIKAGECCSIWGWCGTTSAYCAPGNCQSQCVKPSPPPPSPPPPSPPPPSPPPPLPYPRCGRQSGGGKCIKAGECCSIWGWCGTTSAYCAPGNCQSQCVKPSPPPPSPPPSPSPPPPLPYPRCGKQGGGGKCIKTGECCSIWGWCGITSAYCAPGNCQSQCKSTLTSSVKNRMRGIESF